MSEKIQSTHTEREACVYIRQSSMSQVRHHLEGQRRQYDLRDRAQALGFQRVTVIDDDLGRSGTGSVERPGFGRLLAAVCSGKVGAVLALEASRLARNNRDWHHLIDLCAMAGTLVIDHDGIYDPSLLNDRLLLGLKGTMSEFEISLLRQRAMEAHKQKVRRGLVLTQVPIGYVRTEDDGIEKTPDRQIQEAIAGIFRKFRELGSVRQVLLWYRDEKLPIPTFSRESGNRKIVWREPVYPRIFGILKNPTYAGVFVWGRKQTRTSIVDGRARKTAGHNRPQEQWEIIIPDHHEGYVTWDEFMRNQQQIRSNAGWNARMGAPTGAARNGPALLAGLLRWPAADAVSGSATSRARGMVRGRATGVTEIAATRWSALASPSRGHESIKPLPSRSSRRCGHLESRQHSMLSIIARTRPTKSDARLTLHSRRHATNPTVSNGSIRRLNPRTVSSPPSLRSGGTTRFPMWWRWRGDLRTSVLQFH